MIDLIFYALGTTLMYGSPLIFTALGGVITERSGVVNIGLEGMMVIGALMGATVGYYTQNPWLGFIAAGLAGGALALLHAVACITFRADQTVSGIAINFIGPGLALFLSRLFFEGATNTKPVPNKLPKLFPDEMVSSDNVILYNLNINSSVVIALALVFAVWFVLYKTKWGLRLRSVGEHPAAADTLGINVYLLRYIAVILSGILAGFGGATMTLAVVSTFSPTVISGHGFIALAAVIFGKWTPQGSLAACLLFGFAQAMVIVLGFLEFVAIPDQFLSMFPYILTIVILVLFVGRSAAPKASGKPYEKGIK